jgi:Ni/Fe-hydrogenase subunit HybB-like protein
MAASDRQNLKLMSGGTGLLLIFIALGAAAAVMRLTKGLGAVTNLSDSYPWGLWIGFDVMAGVALAAGGFTITAAVYIFGMEKYRPVAKPAILTAFIGYLMVMLGLFLDIGKPTAFHHVVYMWQPASVLFEVAWCVLLYSAVLFFENISKNKAIIIPLVIAGITLSYGHQSSLGALFLMSEAKLPGLWWSTQMNNLFFLSAIAAGLAMVSLESILGHQSFKLKQNEAILGGLARGTAIALAVYVVARLADLARNGAIGGMFGGEGSGMFLLEFVGGAILPMLLLFGMSSGKSLGGLIGAHGLVIAGVILNRFNVLFYSQGDGVVSYWPTLWEIAVTLGIISLGIFLYRFAVVTWPILSHAEPE